jgi:hypothetical protein
MARTTRVVLTCDLHADGTEAVATVLLSDGGQRAELDLCRSHIDELFGSGRTVSRTKGRSAARRMRDGTKPKGSGARRVASRPSGPSPAAVREWAVANGHTVSGRGRIPAAVLSAYAAAHAGAA